jgi:predicted Zn-dependent protease
MFERLFAASRLTDTGAYPYLRSHPLTVDRIAEARDALGVAGVGQGGQAPSAAANAPTLLHSLMVARARMLSLPAGDAWRQAIALADGAGFAALSPNAQASAAYAALVAGTLARDYDAARRQIPRLQAAIGEAPEWRQVVVPSLLELATLAQDTALAQRFLDTRSDASAHVGTRAKTLHTARWLLLQGGPGNAQAVLDSLQTWVARHTDDAAAWSLLAAAFEARGQTIRAVEAQAQARLAQHDEAGALDRLRAAQDLMKTQPPNEVQAAIIDTKIRDLRLRLREEAVQSRLDR